MRRIAALLLCACCILGSGNAVYAEEMLNAGNAENSPGIVEKPESEMLEDGTLDGGSDDKKTEEKQEDTETIEETEVTENIGIEKAQAVANLNVEYCGHVSNIGWMNAVKNGQTAGTVGKSLKMEALKVYLPGTAEANQIQYRAKGLDRAWGNWTSGGKEAGTTGKALGLEAVEIKLPSTLQSQYNVFYRVHISNIGWLGWAKNGETAGSQYAGCNIEAIEIKVLPASDTSIKTGNAFVKAVPTVEYQAHVSNIGWMGYVNNGQLGGTEGKGLQMEALRVKLSGNLDSKALTYRTCGLGYGWSEWKNSGNETGTTGKALGLQAIQMNISGELAKDYDLYYRVHVANLGWLGWAKNGETAGSRFYGFAIEAVNIKFVPKNQKVAGAGNSYAVPQPTVEYQAHVSYDGWQNTVANGRLAGTTGKSRKIEAIKLNVPYASVNNPIVYRTRSEKSGWSGWTGSSQQSGTTGLSKGIEAIEIKLADELAAAYDVYYRVHSAYVGWLEWTKNGATAGTEGFNYSIEGLEVKLVKKNNETVSNNSFLKMPSVRYRSHVANLGWLGYMSDNGVSGTTGRGLAMEAFDAHIADSTVSGNIEYSVKSIKSGNQWSSWKAGGTMAGSEGNADGLEAVRIRLTGTLSQYIDVYYRVHIANIGWTGWTKNGDRAGSEYFSYSIESIQIKLAPKTVNYSTGSAYYSGVQTGVDVSAYNGNVNWQQVRNSGISFAMLRCVSGRMGALQADAQFYNNIRNATKNGVKVGVYRYGYAMTVQQAQEEANAVVNALRNSGCRLGLPVAYDVEDYGTQGTLSQAELTKIINAFKGVIENNGYKFMLYASKSWLDTKIDMNSFANVDVWIARYRDNTPNLGHGYSGKGIVTMWQYTSSGKVPGISGNVDMNVCYKQY